MRDYLIICFVILVFVIDVVKKMTSSRRLKLFSHLFVPIRVVFFYTILPCVQSNFWRKHDNHAIATRTS